MSSGEKPPHLHHLYVEDLKIAAGGDPWAVNDTLQHGEPDQIAALAESFWLAGATTAQSYDQFVAAKLRYQHAWNRGEGQHPINDAAEVANASRLMNLHAQQLDDIGVNLEQIAATLAESQKLAAPEISGLNAVLLSLDAQVGQAIAARSSQATVDALQHNAIAAVSSTLHTVHAISDAYAQTLADRSTATRLDGYDPAILAGRDADGHATAEDRARAAATQYDHGHRAADEALVHATTGDPQRLADARARLRDSATAADPSADPTARRLAGERLDDFATAIRQGPPSPGDRDPILGITSGDRARQRLDWQRKLEQGNPALGLPGMSPDAATTMLDNAEEGSRVLTTQQAVTGLVAHGMSPRAARAAVDQVSRGISWEDLIQQGKADAALTGGAGTMAETYAGAQSAGAHTFERFTESDVAAAEKIGRRMGIAGGVAELAMAGAEVANGAPPGQTIGSAVGSVGGGTAAGWGAAMLAGSVIGPEGTALIALLAATAGGQGGQWAGGHLGKWLFDE